MVFFAKTKELLDEMKGDYKDFVINYRDAAERLLAAQEIGGSFAPQMEFPYGSFPPALSFVGGSLRPPPPGPPSRLLEYEEKQREALGTPRVWGEAVPEVPG